MNKIVSSLKYVRLYDILSIFIFILLLIPSFLYKLYLRITRQRIWLITEDGKTARDNGYHFFKYMRTEHKDFRAYYVIDKKSHDYQKVKKYGNIIQFRSLKHWLYYLSCEYNISSQKNGNPAQALFYMLHVKFNLFNNRVFLQHGITMNKAKYVFYNETKFKYFICGAKREYEYIKENFGYPEESLLLTGFARYDNLLKNTKIKDNQILIMPTWRNWLGRETNALVKKQIFTETDFYKNWNGLLNNPEFIKFIEENNLKVLFYPHINMQKYLNDFKPGSKNIEIVSADTDIQKMLKESALMITDYSSVSMDFAYLDKPLIYFQFDQKEFRRMQYEEGYFSYKEDGFGPVTKTITETVEKTKSLYKNGKFNNSKTYSEKSHGFFDLNQYEGGSCQKIYDTISKKDNNRPNIRINKSKVETFLTYISLLAIFLNRFEIFFFYTITPVRIVGLLLFLYRLVYKVRVKEKLFKFELFYALFLLGAIIGSFFSYNLYESIKIFIKIGIIIFAVLQYRALYHEIGIEKFKRIFCHVGFMFIILTLVFYIGNLFMLNFNFQIANEYSLGLMVDRKMPRLITLASRDPNYSCLYLMIPLAFYICLPPKTKREKLFYILSAIGYTLAIILTLSRGGIIATFFALFVYFIFNNKKLRKKIKLFAVIFTSIVSMAFISSFMLAPNTPQANSSFITTISERFLKSDGGSGRIKLWQNSIETFKTHPIIGIGVNSTRSYNADHYHSSKFDHKAYLEILSETGIFIFILFLIFIISILIKSFRIRKEDGALSLILMTSLLVNLLFLSGQYSDIFFIHILIVDICATFVAQAKFAHNKNIKVSVLLPTLNTNKDYLSASINSILNQTFSNFELIIVADGGNDDEFINKNFKDSRIKMVKHSKSKGIASSLNEAIEMSNGKYLIRMDADDISEPDRLEQQIWYMEENQDISVASTFFKKFGAVNIRAVEPFTAPNDVFAKLLYIDPIAHPSVIMRTNTIKEKNYLYDPSYERAEDYELWQRMARNGEKLSIMKYFGLKYRVHPGQVTSAKRTEQLNTVEKLHKRTLDGLGMDKTNIKYLFMLSGVSKVQNKRELKKFIKQIISQNKKYNIYNQYSLKKALYSAYDTSCIKNKIFVIPNVYFVIFCIKKLIYKNY